MPIELTSYQIELLIRDKINNACICLKQTEIDMDYIENTLAITLYYIEEHKKIREKE